MEEKIRLYLEDINRFCQIEGVIQNVEINTSPEDLSQMGDQDVKRTTTVTITYQVVK